MKRVTNEDESQGKIMNLYQEKNELHLEGKIRQAF